MTSQSTDTTLDDRCRELAELCDRLWGDALEVEAAETIEARREAYRWFRSRLSDVGLLAAGVEKLLGEAGG